MFSRTDFGKYSIVSPGKVSAKRIVPNTINKPSYYIDGVPTTAPDLPEVKNDEQISKMKDSCKLAANILDEIKKHIYVKGIFINLYFYQNFNL